jgi:hypothetical protein
MRGPVLAQHLQHRRQRPADGEERGASGRLVVHGYQHAFSSGFQTRTNPKPSKSPTFVVANSVTP